MSGLFYFNSSSLTLFEIIEPSLSSDFSDVEDILELEFEFSSISSLIEVLELFLSFYSITCLQLNFYLEN
jgi:hypothetical protein